MIRSSVAICAMFTACGGDLRSQRELPVRTECTPKAIPVDGGAFSNVRAVHWGGVILEHKRLPVSEKLLLGRPGDASGDFVAQGIPLDIRAPWQKVVGESLRLFHLDRICESRVEKIAVRCRVVPTDAGVSEQWSELEDSVLAEVVFDEGQCAVVGLMRLNDECPKSGWALSAGTDARHLVGSEYRRLEKWSRPLEGLNGPWRRWERGYLLFRSASAQPESLPDRVWDLAQWSQRWDFKDVGIPSVEVQGVSVSPELMGRLNVPSKPWFSSSALSLWSSGESVEFLGPLSMPQGWEDEEIYSAELISAGERSTLAFFSSWGMLVLEQRGVGYRFDEAASSWPRRIR